jgi:hypothetical protein
LYKFSQKGVDEGFLPLNTFSDLYLIDTIEEAFQTIKSFQPKDLNDWLKRLDR